MYLFIIGKLDYMINKYWVIYGLKLCLLIYYRNELFNWYQIGTENEVDSCSPGTCCITRETYLILFHFIISRESNEIEFYLFSTFKRLAELVRFIVGLHICIFYVLFFLISLTLISRDDGWWKKKMYSDMQRQIGADTITILLFH